MFHRRPIPGKTRIKKGFAIFPVLACNGVLWLEHYRLEQTWNASHREWRNERVERVYK